MAGASADSRTESAAVEAARAWQLELTDAGYGWLSGPVELGGAGLTPTHEAILTSVLDEYEVPDDTLIRTGTQVLGPSILAHGTGHLRREHLPAVHRGDELMCQLFSEPDAGSDLANITTRATRNGDGWVIDGQKVWCSGGLHADTGLCITRSDPSSSRHDGLSAFVVDMRAPGVEVRRIRQMTGGAEFCEVFLSAVPVGADHLVGAVGGGWGIVIDALMNERASIGNELLPDQSVLERLVLLVRSSPRAAELRTRAAGVVEKHRVARLLERRIREAYRPGQTPGPELALTKLALASVVSAMAALAAEALGPELVADSGRRGTYAWSEFVLGAPGLRIGGGTDEVLKNGVGERVLKLPREPRPERQVRTTST